MTTTMATARRATKATMTATARRRVDGAMGYNDNDDDGGCTTGYEVDNYGEGAMGDDDYDDEDGDGTERCNNQIEATAAAGGNNSHRRSTAESNDNEDNNNFSRHNCATGMRALCWVTLKITTTPMQRRSQAGLRQRRRHQRRRRGWRRRDGQRGLRRRRWRRWRWHRETHQSN